MNKYLTYICVALFLVVGASCSSSNVNNRINDLETTLWHSAIDDAGRSFR